MKPEAIRETLQSLLVSSNISRVVYIDDVFTSKSEIDVEQVLGWFSQALGQNQNKILELIPITHSAPEDVWKREFREQWEQFSADKKDNIVSNLSEVLDLPLNKDREDSSKLRQLFPKEFDYREISPSDWMKEKEQITTPTPENSCVMYLFDQDLSQDSDFTDTGTLSGGGLLKNLIDNLDGANVLCGILSHTIPSIKEEHNYHEAFASTYQVDGLRREKFLPLAKTRLDEPIQFVDGLKKLLLHELCETIKQEALRVVNEAHETAINDIQKLDIYAFDRMVLRSAYNANEWEIETLVRLFQIYQRNNVRSSLTNSDTANSLNELVMKARPTSKVTTVEEEYVYPQVRAIRREELYEDTKLIRHRPLETGDIFVCTGETDKEQYYILLAQPCDLAVRSDGKRVHEVVSLVPIVEVSKVSNKKEKKDKLEWKNYWITRAAIDSFYKEPEKLAILEFKKSVSVKTSVLDLAVLEANGSCRIHIHDYEIPNHLTDGWKKLLNKVVNFYTDIDTKLQRIRELYPELDEDNGELWEATLPEFSFPPTFSQQVQCGYGVFDFGLRRIERYRQPGADGLLKSYAQFLSREAREFDFAH